MNLRATALPLSYFMWVLAASLLAPLGFALCESQALYPTQQATGLAILACLACGGLLWLIGRGHHHGLHRKEGLFVISLGWLLAGVFGALPFILSRTIPGPIDAIFETVSGFTTTGSSILTAVEDLPRSMLFWRSFTHWLGGLGIVVLFLTFLPSLGIVDRHLFRVEATGVSRSSLTPKARTTARILWYIYAGLTAGIILLLWLGGMPLFEALCHGFGAIATGGYAVKNNSIAGYPTYAHVIITLAMYLGGVNFALYYRLLKGDWKFWRDAEFRLYTLLLVGASIISTLSVLWHSGSSLGIALRDSFFTVTSIMTCTGYATADYAQWTPFIQGMLVCLTFIGGSVGSTAGGIKVIRVLIALRWARKQVIHFAHPNEITPTRVGGMAISQEVESQVVGFTMLFVLWWLVGLLVLLACGHDLITSATASIACQSNCGPGLGLVGPTGNFSEIHWLGKLSLTLQMIVGRLEVLTLSALFLPSFWRR